MRKQKESKMPPMLKTRKTAPLKDSERKELRRISKGYGLVKEFCERSGITPPTFRSLVKKGYALERTIEKVRMALMPGAATKDAVKDAVLKDLNADTEDLFRTGSEPRQIAAYLMSEETTLSLSAIARELHYKDHTAVIGNNRRVANTMDVNKEFRGKVERIRRSIIRKPEND